MQLHPYHVKMAPGANHITNHFQVQSSIQSILNVNSTCTRNLCTLIAFDSGEYVDPMIHPATIVMTVYKYLFTVWAHLLSIQGGGKQEVEYTSQPQYLIFRYSPDSLEPAACMTVSTHSS